LGQRGRLPLRSISNTSEFLQDGRDARPQSISSLMQ
jgi:hypothetical protein